MYGQSTFNTSEEFNPSCRAQLPSGFSMSKLDISGRGKASSDNGESVDGEFQSTTTTPLNYMRRTTPTAAPNRRPEAIQEKSYSEESSDLDMDKAFRNIHLTTTSQDFNFNPNIQQQNNNADQEIGNEGGNFGDAGSEATVEPWNYVQSSAMDPARNFSSAGPGGRPSGDNSNIMLGRGGGSFEYPHSLNSFGELSLESRPRDDIHHLLHTAGAGEDPYGQPQYSQQHQQFQYQYQQESPQHHQQHLHHQQQQQQRSGAYRVSPPTVGGNNGGYSGQQQQQQTPHLSQYSSGGGSVGGSGDGGGGSLSAGYGHLIPPPISMAPGPQYQPQSQGPYNGSASGSATTPTSLNGIAAPPPSRRSTPSSTPTQQQHVGYATASQTPLPFVPGAVGSINGSNSRTPTNSAGGIAGYHSNAPSPRYGDAYGGGVPGGGGGGHSLPPQSPHHHHQMQGPPGAGTVGYHTSSSSSAPPMMGLPPMPPVQQDIIYQVQFKRACRSFTLSHRAGISVAERDFVVVEADRGEDVGVVVALMTMQEFMERRMNMALAARNNRDPQQPQGADQEDQNVGCILRLATLHERQQLPDKFHAEKDVVQSCNELAMYGFGLPIMVFDAEFQFDRRKLTIYYDCSVRIDFRDFVRQLYSTYKARIWMKKVSPHVPPDVQPFAAMALATGVQFSNGSGISFN